MNRVVVTGMGALSSLGNNVEDNWSSIVSGKSGSNLITRFNSELFKTKFACEIQDFDPGQRLAHNEIRKSDLFTQYGLYSADEAIEDSNIDIAKMDPFDIGVIWGSGQGGMGTFEEEVKNYTLNNNTPRFNPFFIPKLIANMASGMISIKYGLMGINYTAVSACATSNTAIMDAFNYIRLGKAKVIVTGGSEAPITEASIGGFNAMRALSTNNDNYETASKPFDSGRDGFVMGEGAGALILEDYDHAIKRGAKIYAEIVGAAMTADAYHMTSTHPEGLGAFQAMKFALDEAGIKMSEVNYINAHATSTSVGDLSEVLAISKHLEEKKNKVYISGTKSMTGHLLGAAGAIAAILCMKSIEDNIIPPTINTEQLDEKIPNNLNIVLKDGIDAKVQYALSNTFGFGGHNASIVFKKLIN